MIYHEWLLPCQIENKFGHNGSWNLDNYVVLISIPSNWALFISFLGNQIVVFLLALTRDV
jgi:hypothetical protein